jgi:hypothetical protein
VILIRETASLRHFASTAPFEAVPPCPGLAEP